MRRAQAYKSTQDWDLAKVFYLPVDAAINWPPSGLDANYRSHYYFFWVPTLWIGHFCRIPCASRGSQCLKCFKEQLQTADLNSAGNQSITRPTLYHGTPDPSSLYMM
jgi:hypothetical protein